MNIIVGEIRVKRGLKANLPLLKEGEPAYCTDTKEYYIGTPEGNVLVGSQTSGGGDTGGGSGSGVLVYNTLTELQTAYPGGTSQPVWIVEENSWYYWEGTVTSPTDTTAPVLTITAGGTFTGTKTVSMSVNETADIFYTLDGSTPTTASTKYTAPLSVSATTTLKVFARDIAGNVSTVQTVTYTLDTTTPADTTAPDNVTNLQAAPTANSVSLSWTASASSDVASYDVYNGSTLIANVTGTSYNVTSLTASTQYTFSVRAKDGANNVASGTSVSTTTLAPADTTAPTLTITPAATFTDTQTVNMSTNETATIWYTLDDSDPTTSGTRLQYTSPLTLTETDTIKAYAVDTVGNASVVQTVTYTKQVVLSTIVSDSFNRADSTTSLGTAETGQTWTALNGTYGISANTAYQPTLVADSLAVVESGVSDGEVQCKLSTNSNIARIVFRAIDKSNYLFVQNDHLGGQNVTLYKVVNGTMTRIDYVAQARNANDVYRIVLAGTSVKVYVNDVLKLDKVVEDHVTATKHGIGNSYSANMRFDDFKVLGVV